MPKEGWDDPNEITGEEGNCPLADQSNEESMEEFWVASWRIGYSHKKKSIL